MADVLCPVVVGREHEIQRLQAALEAIGASRGSIVALTGEAGIGKSRLTRVAMELAEKEGRLCAVGRAVPSGNAAPYRLLAEALLSVLRDRSLPDDPSLAPWLPALSGQLHVRMDDGFEIDLVPGDGHVVGPGHDAWVVGVEPCVTLDFIPSATA